MSQEVKTTWVRKPRKATFEKTVDKQTKEVIYAPVNERAHKWARTVGKRTRVTKTDIAKIKATGKVKVYIWTGVKGARVLRKV
jgi:polysaccharide pyruvyl transferase WcaK-like protein